MQREAVALVSLFLLDNPYSQSHRMKEFPDLGLAPTYKTHLPLLTSKFLKQIVTKSERENSKNQTRRYRHVVRLSP